MKNLCVARRCETWWRSSGRGNEGGVEQGESVESCPYSPEPSAADDPLMRLSGGISAARSLGRSVPALDVINDGINTLHNQSLAAVRMGGVPSIPTDRSRTVQVIGAGYSRTGTVSMALALEKLLGGPVMHGGTQLFGREDGRCSPLSTPASITRPMLEPLSSCACSRS